jgi:GH24 family phage-related lysozyme (muramidase)
MSRPAVVEVLPSAREKAVLPNSLGEFGRAFMYDEEKLYLYIYDDKAKNVNGVKPEWDGETPVIGKLTVGYGHTENGAGKSIFTFEPERKLKDRAEAKKIFDLDVAFWVKSLHNNIKVELNQDQFDALLSRFFSLGYVGYTNIVKHINEGDFESVAQDLRRGDNPERREREANLWSGIHETKTPYDTRKEAEKTALKKQAAERKKQEAATKKEAAQKGASAPSGELERLP